MRLNNLLLTATAVVSLSLLSACNTYDPRREARRDAQGQKVEGYRSSGLAIVERDDQSGKGVTRVSVFPDKRLGLPNKEYKPGDKGFDEMKKQVEADPQKPLSVNY